MHEAKFESSHDQVEERCWGGRIPNARLRRLGLNASSLARLDRDLLDALLECGPERQRALAVWAAREACTLAGIANLSWVATALAALDSGQTLPEPFHDLWAAMARLDGGWQTRLVSCLSHASDAHPEEAAAAMELSKPHAALPAVIAATQEDPLQAVCDALWGAVGAAGMHSNHLLSRSWLQLRAARD